MAMAANRKDYQGKPGANPGQRLVSSLLHGLGFVRSRLKNRADTEHEMTLNRLILNSIVFLYLVIAGRSGFVEADVVFSLTSLLFIGYNLLSLALFAHILYRPGISRFRRCLAIFLDLGMISYVAYVGGGVTAFLYPLFLWTIFGNGFRFGLPYLALSMVVGVTSFACVITLSPFWRLHATLSFGLLAGLVMLPLYVGVLIRKLSEAKRQAEQANEAKSLFLASVSHELRTPLTAIIGLSELLQDQTLNREQQEMAHTIGSSGRALLRQINSLLDFSRAEVGKMPLERSLIDLHALLAETRNMLAVQARAKGLQLTLHIAAATPRHILASQRHLQEALLNLASNAVKFTEKGFVLISVDVAHLSGNRIVLRFEVKDTGIGIAREAQSRIFETFTQADATIIDRFGGTGLGLAITRQLVQAHKGTISVESRPGHGSTFRFEVEAGLPPGTVTVPRTTVNADRPVLIVSGDPQLKAEIDQLGGPAASASAIEEIDALIAQAGTGRHHKVILFLDAVLLGDRLEPIAAEISANDPAGRILMIALLKDKDTSIVTPDSRRLFGTCLPRPWNVDMLANALDMAGYAPLRRRRSDGAGAPAAESGGRRILLAEDNRTNQKVIARILERAGHKVEIVGNGEAALDALANGAFDLVLMDINMPVMNGIEASKFYRFTEVNGPHVPMIALTADASEENQQKCRNAGMVACLMKPIDTASLTAAIQNFACPEITPAPERATRDASRAASLRRALQPSSAMAVDMAVLAELEALGGPDFVNEIVTQFSDDAANVLHGLVAAVKTRDADSFRNSAHALRSCAANVGAHRIYETCLEWREIGPDDLTQHGLGFLARLEDELQQAHAALETYRNRSAPAVERRAALKPDAARAETA